MPSSEHRSLSSVLIPAVIALITMIGLNALLPDLARSRKIDLSGEPEVSQLADDVTPAGRLSNTQVFAAPHPDDVTRFLGLPSGLVLIDNRRGQPVFGTKEGAVQGRAPPTRLFA
jgi:hypothetical protein